MVKMVLKNVYFQNDYEFPLGTAIDKTKVEAIINKESKSFNVMKQFSLGGK